MVFTNSLSSHYEKNLSTGEVKCIDDEIPFEIPENWCWCRLIHFASVYGGKRIPVGKKLTRTNTGFVYIRVADMKNASVKTDDLHYVPLDVIETIKKYTISKDNVYITVAGTIGNVGLIPDELDGANLTENANKIVFTIVNREWLLRTLDSPFVQGQISNVTRKVGQPKLAIIRIENLLIPLPPLEEQYRIVQKLESFIPHIDKYTTIKSELDTLNASLNDLLKKSILQEAIQGKLVPQCPEEGTAQELLEQIRQEKQKLIKEGKLKKSSVSDSIIYKGADNKYYERIGNKSVLVECDFDFPNTWQVLRLKDICLLTDGDKQSGRAIVLDAKFLRGKSNGTYTCQGKIVKQGDNIILVDGENSGEVFNVPQDGYMGSTFKKLWTSKSMYTTYILLFISYYKDALRNSKKGAAIPHLNKELFYNLPIGIPPFAEQERIAERITELSQLLK